MKHMNYNAAENQPHKYARPVTLDEMNRMRGRKNTNAERARARCFPWGAGFIRR